jgi:hypothetical protein
LKYYSALGVQRGDFVHDLLWAAVRDCLAAVRVLHGEVVGHRVDGFGVQGPGFRGIRKILLELDELGQIGIIQRVDFAEIAAGIELLEPDLASLRAFFE